MQFSEQYQARHALKSPPHITIFPPFKLPVDWELQLAMGLADAVKVCTPFGLTLDGYGCFRPRVIYLNVQPTDLLTQLHKIISWKMNAFLGRDSSADRPFHPHLTLATRDLTHDNFHKAWQAVQHAAFAASITVQEITLLKHNGKNWDIINYFNLGDVMLPG